MVSPTTPESAEQIIDRLAWSKLSPDDLGVLNNESLNRRDPLENWVDLLSQKGIIDITYAKERLNVDMIYPGANGANHFLERYPGQPVGIIITRDNWGKKSDIDAETRDYAFARWDSARNKFLLDEFELDVNTMNTFLQKMYEKREPIGTVDSGVSTITLHADQPTKFYAHAQADLVQ